MYAGEVTLNPAEAPSAEPVPQTLRAIPIEDRAWLLPALADALNGGAPVLPVAPGTDPKVVRDLQAEALPEGTALVIRTSGSTGIPKAVALSAAALRASAEATHEALGGPGQWLVTLPANLISGAQMLVRAAVSGIDPLFFDGQFDPRALLSAAAHMGEYRSYLSVVPVQLVRLLDLAETDGWAADQLRSFDTVLVGGQAITLSLRRRCHDLGVTLARSYGMTETSGGCVYDGVEIGDTEVRVRGGEVQIAGPHLALGYVGDPAGTADCFIEDNGTRWYRTGDAGELLGGMLTVTGRVDRVIVSGGVNVSLDEVERSAAEHPGWEHAVAAGVADAEWGARPVLVRAQQQAVGVDQAGVDQAGVDQPGANQAGFDQVGADQAGVDQAGADQAGVDRPKADRVSFESVRQVIRDRLGAAAAPDRVVEFEAIPMLPGNKPDRRAIDEMLAAAHGHTQPDNDRPGAEQPSLDQPDADRPSHG